MPKNSDDSSCLIERQFQALVKQLDVLVRTAESAASDQKLMAYWQMGELILGRFIADFCATRERLVVEVDGQQHLKRRAADARPDAQLNQLGFAVLRLPASDVELRFELCLARVVDALGL